MIIAQAMLDGVNFVKVEFWCNSCLALNVLLIQYRVISSEMDCGQAARIRTFLSTGSKATP